MTRFSDEEIRRYSRQIVMPEVGGVGQERLRSASVEAADEVEALYLAGAGVGRLQVPSPAIADACRALNPLVQATVSDNASANVNDLDVEASCLRAFDRLRELLEL